MKEETLLEIYKELGTHERHFNSLQGVYRGLASTWFLACFAAIGFVYSKENKVAIPFNPELLGGLISAAVSTGLFLFWILDVLIYHRLLLAILASAKKLEEENSGILPTIRQNMEKVTESLNARTAISIYYFIPIFILIVTASLFLTKCWGHISQQFLYGLLFWIFILLIGGICFLANQKRWKI